MRIGIDCRIYSSKFTGIGRYTYELVKHFIKFNKELKNKYELVLFFNSPEFEEFEPPNDSVKKVLADAAHYSLREQTHFLKVLNKEKCDIVHFPHFNLPVLYRRPFTVTIHDLTISFFPGETSVPFYKKLAYSLIIKHAAKRSKRIVAVSQYTKNDIINYLKIPEDKIEVIYNGVGDEFHLIENPRFNSLLKKYNITKPFLLYTGVWRYHKNIPTLLSAFSQVKDNLSLQLVITGNYEKKFPEIKEAVKNLKLTDDVIFPGHVPEKELVELYNAAFIYVFPSLYEGFGLPPLESMKCGTPVIVSNSSSLPEVCGEGNALFFDPKNTDELVSQIQKLYKDSDLQAELIDNGFQHANKFTWEKSARKTFNLICSKISRNS